MAKREHKSMTQVIREVLESEIKEKRLRAVWDWLGVDKIGNRSGVSKTFIVRGWKPRTANAENFSLTLEE